MTRGELGRPMPVHQVVDRSGGVLFAPEQTARPFHVVSAGHKNLDAGHGRVNTEVTVTVLTQAGEELTGKSVDSTAPEAYEKAYKAALGDKFGPEVQKTTTGLVVHQGNQSVVQGRLGPESFYAVGNESPESPKNVTPLGKAYGEVFMYVAHKGSTDK
jgi:hypothetical protein